jgi:type IX secretion system PorP/SprF family membrane protein
VKKLLTILIFISSAAVAQHVPLQSQYMFNAVALNPAFTGSEEALSIVGSYRAQWVGFDGAPSTQTLTAHAPLKQTNSAVGLQLFADQIGVDRRTGIFGSYSYKLKFDKSWLTFGMAGGINFLRSYYTRLDVVDNNDQNLMSDSPLGVLPEFSFGAHYYTDKYFLSFSVPKFLTHDYVNSKFKVRNDFKNYNYMFGGGVVFNLSNGSKIKPSVLAKYRADSDMQFDFNVMALLNKAIDVGVSYRTSEAIIGLVEIRPTQQLGIMYSFGMPLSTINQYSNGSHEISLKYTFLYKTKIADPRFLGW